MVMKPAAAFLAAAAQLQPLPLEWLQLRQEEHEHHEPHMLVHQFNEANIDGGEAHIARPPSDTIICGGTLCPATDHCMPFPGVHFIPPRRKPESPL
jgi:hypothetical protein